MKDCNCGKNCNCEKSRNSAKKNLQCDCEVIHNELVEKVVKNALDDELVICIADFYKAMSDSTRVKILNLLEMQELCVCDISFILNMTKSAVSHQLKNLKEMNLIKGRKQGKEVWYSLADRHIKDVFDVSLEHIMENREDEKNS